MQIGTNVAQLLGGSCRGSSFHKPQLLSEQLQTYGSVIASAGGAALMWFRFRSHKSQFSSHVLDFYHREYLGSILRATVHESELQRIIQGLQVAAVRSILLKGWSVGRLYPE